MDYKKMAEMILKNIGGLSNIENLTHCATRLRFTIKDSLFINDSNINNINGVIATVKSGNNYQVVIGNEVGKVYDIIMENFSVSSSNKTKKDFSLKGFLKDGLDVLSSCMVPLVPAIVAAGMLNVFISIIKLILFLDLFFYSLKLDAV